MLILAGTPIGRAADASARLAQVLSTADVVAAEDTRRLLRLASELGVAVPGRLVSYFEGNESRRTPELIAELQAGKTVLVVTDAGMPSVSDPGYRIVTAAVSEGIRVTAIPGPSAVLTALAVSGLPVDRFCFEGFPPRRPGERARFFSELCSEVRTMVFFESPHRTDVTLDAMADAFGSDRRAVVCRELTKTYEEVVRGTLAELVVWSTSQDPGIRGEVTLVVAGYSQPLRTYSVNELAALVVIAESAGLSRKDAIAKVSHDTGVRRREVYNAAHASDQ